MIYDNFQIFALMFFGSLLYFGIMMWISERDIRMLEEELNRGQDQ